MAPPMGLKTNQKLALARTASLCVGLARAAAGRGPLARARRGGVEWDLDLREAIDFTIYLIGAFEARLGRRMRKLVRPGAVVIDVGANIGAHTLPLARAVGETGRLLAYEPSAFAFAKLQANLALNPALAPRVSAHQVMLVGGPGVALPPMLYASWPLHSRSGTNRDHGGRGMPTAGARVATLDGHLEELGLDRVDLIKLDVDGHECEVLAGAARTLERHRPLLVMEWAPYCHLDLGHELSACLSTVRALDYAFQDAVSGQPLSGLGAAPPGLARGASLNVIGRAAPVHHPV